MRNKFTIIGILAIVAIGLFWVYVSKSAPIQSQAVIAKNTSGLTDFQKQVLYQKATEPPYKNEYWDEHREGVYVAADTGEVLFSSKDKFDSGTGWPSFTKPIDPSVVKTQVDYELGFARQEVTTKTGAHLGHVFADGPSESGGLRYCINSAALKFIPTNK